MEQVQRFERALATFVAQWQDQPNIIGILATGSLTHARLYPQSDIDVFLLTRPGTPWRKRGNTWVDGVEIEYFFNPPEQIRAYLRQQEDRPTTAHMFAHGRLMYAEGEHLAALIEEAKTYWEKPPQAWTEARKELMRYQLDDLQKDLEDCLGAGEHLTASMIGQDLIQACLTTYFGLKRLHVKKVKRLLPFCLEHHPEFGQRLEKALAANGIPGRYEEMQPLVAYVEDMLGGRRPQEWTFEGPLDLR
ncbi:MAG: hypothetical protein AAFR61_20530 [Bacteroidota bacterium]